MSIVLGAFEQATICNSIAFLVVISSTGTMASAASTIVVVELRVSTSLVSTPSLSVFILVGCPASSKSLSESLDSR